MCVYVVSEKCVFVLRTTPFSDTVSVYICARDFDSVHVYAKLRQYKADVHVYADPFSDTVSVYIDAFGKEILMCYSLQPVSAAKITLC